MRADALANRQAIIDAACRMFGRHGTEVALSTIAESAGTGIATLYRHFPERIDLLRAVTVKMSEKFLEIEKSHSHEFNKDPEAAWNRIVHELAALKPGSLLAALFKLFDEAGMNECATNTAEQVNASLERILLQGKTAGLVREDINADKFHVALATITRPLTDNITLDCAASNDWLIDLFIKGLHP